jgi:hypothetical protein
MKMLFGAFVGAGLAWLFDPQAGPDRRESLRKKLTGLRGGTQEVPAEGESSVEAVPASIAAST